jgi:hypothetical protein
MSSAKFVASILGPFSSNLILPYSLIYLLLMMALMWFVVYVMLVYVWQDIHIRTGTGFFGYLSQKTGYDFGGGGGRSTEFVILEEIPCEDEMRGHPLTLMKQHVREAEPLVDFELDEYKYIPNSYDLNKQYSSEKYSTFQ